MSDYNELLNQVRQQQSAAPSGPLPILSLEDFFEGNDDPGSIGCNILDHPGTQAFYSTLKQIRARPEVQDVLVEIYETIKDDEYVKDGLLWGRDWPLFSERVYIISSASIKQVVEWARLLCPDEVDEGWAFGKAPAAPDPEQGHHVYSLWWD